MQNKRFVIVCLVALTVALGAAWVYQSADAPHQSNQSQPAGDFQAPAQAQPTAPTPAQQGGGTPNSF